MLGAVKSELSRVGQQAREGRAATQPGIRWPSEGRIPSWGEPQSFFFRLSTNWIRLTHILEYNLLYSKPTDLNVNHILKIPSQQHLD